MTLWFFENPDRLQLERSGIDSLLHSADWLLGYEWMLDDGLCLDVVVRAHDHDYDLRVSFPSLYPDVPAVVRPRNMANRISGHQYGGADGPLCLQWGPDNWLTTVTAVDLLESAYRLLETENPLGTNKPEIPVAAPSRHQLTLGQESRRESFRWYASTALIEFFTAQEQKAVGNFKFSLRRTGKDFTVLIHELTLLGGTAWQDEIPKNLPGALPANLTTGVCFKTELETQAFGNLTNFSDLQALLRDYGGDDLRTTEGSSVPPKFNQPVDAVLVADRGNQLTLFYVFGEDSVLKMFQIRSDTLPSEAREPYAASMEGKTIGIVGLGSAGSKLALSLARMGARKFYLVDHDVFLPENLKRHELNWQAVAQHKVDAMATAITQVAANAEVEVCRLHLTGQESNAAISGTFDRLGQCDLLVDATANPRVFNLIDAVARRAGRSMVWLEVFAGGIGGFVARSRPGIDPCPIEMRAAFLQFCADHPFQAPAQEMEDYAMVTGDGKVMVASDAEVAVLANHAARFVPDCFLPHEQSKFPYSMYLVGLTTDWIFQPFEVIPIAMESYSTDGWSRSEQSKLTPETGEFLLDLLQKKEHALTDTKGNNPPTD